MAKAILVAAPTASEIVPMMFTVGDRAILAPIPDICLTVDCDRVASRLMLLTSGGEISISWICEVCADAAKEGLARLTCNAARKVGEA